jgi:hypothetical protein
VWILEIPAWLLLLLPLLCLLRLLRLLLLLAWCLSLLVLV